VLWLLYPYRIITVGSNKHNGDNAPSSHFFIIHLYPSKLFISFLIPCTFSVPNLIVLLRILCRCKLHLSEVFVMVFFLTIPVFRWAGGWAYCINPQPGGQGDFWSRFSSSNPWHASIKLRVSSASFGPPRVFYFPGTHHIWWAFTYPPPGEAPNGRLATPHGRAQEDVQTSNNLLNK